MLSLCKDLCDEPSEHTSKCKTLSCFQRAHNPIEKGRIKCKNIQPYKNSSPRLCSEEISINQCLEALSWGGFKEMYR